MFGMKKKPEPGWSCARCGSERVVEAKWHHGTGIKDCVSGVVVNASWANHALDKYPPSHVLSVLREAKDCLHAAIERTELAAKESE